MVLVSFDPVCNIAYDLLYPSYVLLDFLEKSKTILHEIIKTILSRPSSVSICVLNTLIISFNVSFLLSVFPSLSFLKWEIWMRIRQPRSYSRS